MHALEPFYNWRNLYTAEDDEYSPFYGKEYSEFYFTDRIYDHVIHPQWDNIGSTTLFVKLLFVEYSEGFAVIELIGEWNDTLYNDIMTFKRDIIDHLIENGINKFILIGENVLNFHSSDDCYYEEWFEDVEDGWIALVNFREHVIREFVAVNVDQFFLLGGNLNDLAWRTRLPEELYRIIDSLVMKRIGV
ncbi:MAG: hypothetical protein CL840_11275 [Crocinitomicaceae bacterium]|nr:hypothetical protein [Crocinitomicaceae bacterium]|tara:strand:+ start:4125 stop:4694 length:570 start_codon:yes stop_codon:yes gene_type:complete